MQPNPQYTNQPPLPIGSHPNLYDPSEPYRALIMPTQPVITEIPNDNIYPPNSLPPQDVLSGYNNSNYSTIGRIPQFYYPRYDDTGTVPTENPTVVEPAAPKPKTPVVQTQPPNVEQQPPSNTVVPYYPPAPKSIDPYQPYPAPYIVPLPNSLLQPTSALPVQMPPRSDILLPQQRDADLSRVEVYHYAPKQNSAMAMGAPSTQPIIQYHLYSYPPSQSYTPPIPALQSPPQQYLPHPGPWYGRQPYGPPYAPDPSQLLLPPIETKARGSQTDPPRMKNRAVSPIYSGYTTQPVMNEDGYPYIHHQAMHTEQYHIPTGRINRKFYENTDNHFVPLGDCRCLNCQRERSKVLNYYPE